MKLSKEEMVLLNYLPSMGMITNKKGKILFINETLSNTLECSIDDVQGKNILNFVNDEDAKNAQIAFKTFLKDNKSKPNIFNIITPLGSKRTIEIISKIGGDNVYHCLKDVGELKKNQDALEQNRKLIKLINTILRHDLANDLNVLLSALNIFEKENNKKMLLEIRKRINKSIRFIAQMRSLESITISTDNLRLCNLEKIFDDVVYHYPGIAININGNNKVIADETLHSIFTNIFNNAIHHGNANSITIDIENHKDEVYTLVKISNNGDKIDEDILKDIFKHGVKSKNTGNTGMGLYIVKENMLRYGGNILVRNNEEGSVCFELRFKSI
jgi:signal transduction histidine kinase